MNYYEFALEALKKIAESNQYSVTDKINALSVMLNHSEHAMTIRTASEISKLAQDQANA